jgi:hypothetical protein
MDGGGVPPPTPQNAPHTAFVGDQTWQGIGLGSFTIPLPNVSIFNNLGQNVYPIFNDELAKGENKLKINTANFSKGIYYLNITMGNQTSTKKLIIE